MATTTTIHYKAYITGHNEDGKLRRFPFGHMTKRGDYIYEFDTELHIRIAFSAMLKAFNANPYPFGYRDIVAFDIVQVTEETTSRKFKNPIVPTGKPIAKPDPKILESAFGI